MADYSHLKSVIAPWGPQTNPERVELSSSAHGPSTPVAPYGAPSLGLADRIDFPIEAHRAFGEAGQ